MLISSQEYLKALRQEDYLRFLEWPLFISKSYRAEYKEQDADDTINLIIFEWLVHGFCEEDAKKVALLFAVHEAKNTLLQGNLAYSLMSILIATYQCMMFLEKKLTLDFPSSNHNKVFDALTCVQKKINEIDANEFESLLQKQQQLFLTWVNDYSKVQIENVFKKIKPITELRYLVQHYSALLESIQDEQDKLLLSRLGVVKRLNSYLSDLTELNSETIEHISSYIRLIKDMQPAEWESVLLNKISPPSTMESSWQFVAKLGMTLFKLIDTPHFLDNEKKESSLKL